MVSRIDLRSQQRELTWTEQTNQRECTQGDAENIKKQMKRGLLDGGRLYSWHFGRQQCVVVNEACHCFFKLNLLDQTNEECEHLPSQTTVALWILHIARCFTTPPAVM